MTKYLNTTTIYVHGIDTPVVFTDTATYAGGSAAKAMIKMRHDVKVKDENGVEIYIPFHAIIMATFEPSTETVEDPTDAFCAEVEEAADGGDGGNDGGNDGGGGEG